MKVGSKTQPVRFAFVHVFEPRSMDEASEPKYEVMVLLNKEHAGEVVKLKKAIAEAKEKGKTEKWAGKIPANTRLPIKDGDSEEAEGLNIKGNYYFTARSKRKPQILDRKGNLLEEDEGFYSGCFGLVSVDIFPYKHKTGGPGISIGLNNIMKLDDGDRMAGAPSAQSDFADDLEDGADDDF